MTEGQIHIPTEYHSDLLGITIPVHWGYHALLMVGVWFVLVPICIIVIRFGKPKPTLNGIREKVSIWNAAWWWFSVHKYGLMLAIGLALAGAVVALTVQRRLQRLAALGFRHYDGDPGHACRSYRGWRPRKARRQELLHRRSERSRHLVRRPLQHDRRAGGRSRPITRPRAISSTSSPPAPSPAA